VKAGAPATNDAGAIATAVGSGRQSAVAVAQATLDRIAAYDRIQPQVWISRFPDAQIEAMAAEVDARVAAGGLLPLAGVPFAVKDNIDVAGLATTAACPAYGYEPAQSATVVRRLVDAGAIPVGKTNLDQFATGLVGTRSPHGAPGCVFNRTFISGGSSSGSAVAVAAGLVPLALGTDTAGSGRVPAAFNHLVGYKPSKGRWSSTGLVPACRSLDCVSVFTTSAQDAQRVDTALTHVDTGDPWSRVLADRPLGRRLGIPLPAQRQWCGDFQSEALFTQALERAEAMGFILVEVDIAALLEAAGLLYAGPWVAERTAAVESFLRARREAFDPVVRAIIEGGRAYSAVDAFNGQYALAALSRRADDIWRNVDALILPTTPTIYRHREIAEAPVTLNANLGIYTNFVNLLDMAAVAVPAGFRSSRTGFGVSFIAPAGTDRALLDLAAAWDATDPHTPPPLDLEGVMETVRLAVVGAHLRDMPLHWQLSSRKAVFAGEARTAPCYRLYAMAGGTPPKPALVHDMTGSAIAIELYDLGVEAFGSFTAEVPPPLAIGTVALADGSSVKGFVAEPRALAGATDITALGGWRAYMASLQP